MPGEVFSIKIFFGGLMLGFYFISCIFLIINIISSTDVHYEGQ